MVLAIVAVFPSASFAQSAIAGVVKDASGAVLPDVLVEASSPSLIEQSRTGVTDNHGLYRIEDLRPGTYAVRFTRTGLRAYQRDGVELPAGFTASIDAQLEIGSVSETVVVSVTSPVVDIRRAKNDLTLSGDAIKSIPVVRAYNALLNFIPGVVTSLNDVVISTAATSFPIHGGRTNEGRLSVDGLNVGSPPSGNSATSYVVDVGEAQDIEFSTGGLGEVETAGLTINVVPKAGGNTTRGSLFVSGTSEGLQSNNVSPSLAAQGVAASPLSRVYDVSGTIGGAIAVNRVWYFVNAHTGGSSRESSNVYYNLNAGDPGKWQYLPDLNRREYSDRTFENASGRITWQVSPRHKLSAFWDAQALCRTCSGATPGLSEPPRVSPEAVGVLGRSLHVTQAAWSSPIRNTLLLEAGFGSSFFGVGNFERNPNPTRDLIRVAEQCASGCAANGNIPGLVYRSQDFSVAHTGSYLWQGSITHATGAHALKIGYQHTFMTDNRTWMTNSQNLTYRLNNGQPNQLTESISPWVNDARVAWDGVFVQEQWTHARLTLHGALRFDRARSWFPPQQEGPSRFLPSPILIPETRGIDSYKDVTPRMGAAVDLFGNGKTALRTHLGKYLEGAGVSGNYANTNPSLRMPQTTSAFGTAGVTRAWIDANGNFLPDCDLLNPAAQDLRPGGGDLCGVMSNTNFGQNALMNGFDHGILNGWGIRPADWSFDASLEQQIFSRASVSVTYSRRSFQGFSAVDNLALEPSDLTPYSIVAPIDRKLPGGGGYTVSGLYDVIPEKAGQVRNFVTDAAKYGKWSQHFSGVDVIVNLRAGRRAVVGGGTSTGQTISDNCAVRESLPELSTTTTGASAFGAGLNGSIVSTTSPYCRVAYGVLTQFRGLASFLIPRVDIQLAATFQTKPGALLSANYAVPNNEVAPTLGRSLSGNAQNVTVNLVEPGTMYGNRINELDLRAAKTFKLGRSHSTFAVETYNTLNSSAVLTYNMAYVAGGTWLQPLSIMTPRLLKFTAAVEF